MSDIKYSPETAADMFCGRPFGGPIKGMNDVYLVGDGAPVKQERRNKSKQAYDILKSLDYEYDLVKQRWFKKEYI